MSLIDDARRIAAAEAPMRADTWCWFCPARLVGYEHFVEATPHEPNCPWLSLPRIVRVLEAAQEYLDAYDAALKAPVRYTKAEEACHSKRYNLRMASRSSMRDAP